MSCKHFEDQIIEYLDGELQSDSIAALEGHLKDCSACSAEFAATRESLSALDGTLGESPEMDIEAGLAAVRQRLQEEEVESPAVSWSVSLRWWLGGGLAAAAAAGLLAVALTGIEPASVNTVAPVSSDHPGVKRGQPSGAEAAKMKEMLEDMPLYENLDCFQEYEHLAAMIDENPEKLEEILREVQG
jgi:anti-sigma factor RsiW